MSKQITPRQQAALDAYHKGITPLALGLKKKEIYTQRWQHTMYTSDEAVLSAFAGEGNILDVVGVMGSVLGDFEGIPQPETETLAHAWDLALSQRRRITVWSAPLADFSPDLFQVGQVRPGLERTQFALSDLCDCLAILQFCSSVTEQRGMILAQVSNFNGPGIEIAEERSADADATFHSVRRFPPLYSVYRWAFPSESRTKIDVVRRVIRESFPRVETLTIPQLQEQGDALLQAAESTFAIVCRRAFKAYLQSREEVERGIQEFLKATYQRISALGDEVLRSSLQFFTGALAIVVANLFHQDISNTAKQFGLALGLAYIALIAIFRLLRIYRQHKSQLQQSNALIDVHRELPESLRDTYKTQLVAQSATAFNRWFAATVIFYGVCAALFVALLIALN